jgi:ornithine carbamoyltransferase
MTKRNLISITDLNIDEIHEIFRISGKMKDGVKNGVFPAKLDKKTLAMIFMKPSLRTRCTFEIGMYQLGGHAVYLAPADIGLEKRESAYDVAKNLERWFDIVMARVFKHQTVKDLGIHSEIPVINALCDTEHPCQVMADFLSVLEHREDFKDFTMTYIGDGNNVCNSLILISAILGTNIRVSSPEGYEPKQEIIEKAGPLFEASGGSFEFFNDPSDSVKNTGAIYTDVWASMGQEKEADSRKKIFEPYQINMELMKKAPSDVMIMHDLPAHRGEEITDDVIDSPNAIVFDQAENRLHAQKGIMVFLLNQK